MYKTKIDWCDSSWNPVTGCLHGCDYCYARKIAERFGLDYAPMLGDPGMEGACKYDSTEGMDTMLELAKPYRHDGKSNAYPMGFAPTFHRYRLDIPSKWSEPRTIFVGSMTDIFGEWVPDEWIREVFAACDAAWQHRYLFLTKNPARYVGIKDLMPAHRRPPNVAEMWFGVTITGNEMPYKVNGLLNTFVSIEPIQERLTVQTMKRVVQTADWAIVGAETGNRRGKVIPSKEWIEDIAFECQAREVPIFMKDSLRALMGDDFRQEFPWEV